jgi:hypothetical protein
MHFEFVFIYSLAVVCWLPWPVILVGYLMHSCTGAYSTDDAGAGRDGMGWDGIGWPK